MPKMRTQIMTFDVIIIGGGAAGLFCAVQLGRQGKSCAVIEHSDRCGKKLRITGKGRCNVTNNCDAQTVMNNIPRNSKFLFSALSRFTPEDTMSFFECLGVELKTERGNRVFPASDNAGEIVNSLLSAAEQSGTVVIYDNARELVINGGAVCGVKCEKEEYCAENVIVATGGKSYPKTGSTGDGYRFAGSAGHRITAITPSLCPIVTAECGECAEAMGLSLKNCTLSLRKGEDPKPIYKEQGEMLYTHFGLSGPLILSASAHLGDLSKSRYFLDIDLKPALSDEQLDVRILRDWGEFPNRDFGNSLGKLLPAKLIPIIVKRSGIAVDKKVNQITKDERERLVSTLKRLTYTVRNMRPIDEAIITRGGVETSEINPKTMESKLCKGLYFIGEVLDVDGYTGGFNLQIAFATANAAAQALSG